MPTFPRQGMCFANDVMGKEWIELRFPNSLHVSGVSLYELWSLGSLSRIATTAEYVDDNAVPCQRDTCSMDSTWNTIWQGTAALVDPVNGQGRIQSPPVRKRARMDTHALAFTHPHVYACTHSHCVSSPEARSPGSFTIP